MYEGMTSGGSQRDKESQTPYTGPGSEYGRPTDSGWQWNEGSGTRFANENPIDPNTGMFEPGKGGLVPHNVALQMQALSDQGIWRSKQAMMRSGMNYAKGALGLLQSFRPGGGATLESGIYNQLGMMEFQRAQQTDYLDLLGDYRRQREDQARRSAKKAQDRAMYTQIATAVIGAGAMIATGGAAAPAVAAMGAIGSAAAANQQSSVSPGAAQSLGALGPKQGTQAAVPNVANIGGQPRAAGSMSPTGPYADGYAYPQQNPQIFQSQMAPGGQPQQAGAGAQNVSIGGAGEVGGGMAGASGAQAGGGMKQLAQPGQAAVGMAGPMVGFDGDFSPTAYSAHAARSYVDAPMQALASASAASMMDDDPFFETMSFAVNNRWNQRLMQEDSRFGSSTLSDVGFNRPTVFGDSILPIGPQPPLVSPLQQNLRAHRDSYERYLLNRRNQKFAESVRR
jgi:hypothetical protein